MDSANCLMAQSSHQTNEHANFMSAIALFEQPVLERLCEVLADTDTGLTGGEIGKFLRQLGINDPNPGMTKRVRLFDALNLRQQSDHCGNLVAAFIHEAMNPVRHSSNQEYFERKRHELNEVLAFAGYELSEQGKLRQCQAATTISEAQERAGRLRKELQRRGVHGDVLLFCRAEWLQGNCFHAVLEATKSVGDKIRKKSGLTTDGSDLVDDAFGLGKVGIPFLAFNTLQTESERSEHKGLMNLMKGMFGTFRNPIAHAPKIHWNVSEQDALDLLTMASFLHRRLDAAVRTPRT
jgi:uncharacterized protein (TIGR02391 family)